jgi:DNA polymerase
LIPEPASYSAAEFWQEAESLGRAAQVSLEYFQAMGLEALDAAIPAPASAPSAPPPAARPREAVPKGKPEEKTTACQGCALSRERQSAPVTGRGSQKPLIAFVGGSPGIFEAEAAGLLAAMIEKGLKLGPDNFYITSLIKCAVQDGAGFPAQAAAECLPLLLRELALLRPPIVLALGKWPGRFLSGRRGEHLLMLRQRTYTISGLDQTWLRVTYSLDELLTTPELKKEAWKDLQKIIPVIKKLQPTEACEIHLEES